MTELVVLVPSEENTARRLFPFGDGDVQPQKWLTSSLALMTVGNFLNRGPKKLIVSSNLSKAYLIRILDLAVPDGAQQCR